MTSEEKMEVGGWQEWLAAQRAGSTMTVEVVPLAQTRGWGMTGETFCRPDGKFFRLVGLRVSVPKEGQREVPSWDQPLLEEVGGEHAVVLIRARGDERYLLSAKPEPGNDRLGGVLLAATLQASRANLEQAHGGSRPPRAALLDGKEIAWTRLPMDGGRYYRKEVAYAVVVVDPADVVLAANERWFLLHELRDAVRAGEVNEHLALVLLVALI